MASASLFGAFHIQRPEVVIATSPQLLCGIAGYVLAMRFGVPFVFEVRDLWPESILAVQAMKDNSVLGALRRVALFLYTHANCIVTVGEGYRSEIHKRYGIPLHRMEVVPNGLDTELFVPGERLNGVRNEYGWGDRFVVLYMGTLGMAHSLHIALEAAAKLRNRPEIVFAFVGEGAEKENLKTNAAREGLSNVQFIDHQPKKRVPLFYSACDLGLVPLRNTPLFQSVLPSKIFEYLGMAKPILLSVDGEARRLVEGAQAGWYVPPENSQALCDAVLKAWQHRELLMQMGERGRQFVLTHYDRRPLSAKYLGILMRAIESSWRANGRNRILVKSEPAR